jgi:hypothetical protein
MFFCSERDCDGNVPCTINNFTYYVFSYLFACISLHHRLNGAWATRFFFSFTEHVVVFAVGIPRQGAGYCVRNR